MSVDQAKQKEEIPPHWQVKIGKSIYGPYQLDKMKSLVAQGLLSPHSQIVGSGEKNWNLVSNDPTLSQLFKPKQKSNGADLSNEPFSEPELEAANFALIFDIQSDISNDLKAAIRELGPASEITKTFWILSSELSAGAIRNALISYMAYQDKLFVIDATRNKTAWFNHGPEVDSRVRKVWK